MSWWPTNAPHQERKPDEYTDSEIRSILAYAEEKIAAQPGDTPERRRLITWLGTFEAEQADRARVRAAFAAEQRKQRALTIVPGGGDPPGEEAETLALPPQNAASGDPR